MPRTAKRDQDFTVDNRMVLSIAVPMTLAYLSTPLLGVVDTAVIGQLGNAALLGGIAIGGILFDLVFTTFNFLRSGTTGLAAQALGAGAFKEMRAVLYRALLIAIVAGLIVIVLQWPVLEGGLYFLGGSSAVQEATRDYFAIRIYSAPFLLGNYAILGWVLGLGRAALGLLLQTFLNGLNILLSIWFVLGLDLGVGGVALATLLSEGVTFALGLTLALRIAGRGPRPSWQRIFDRHRFSRLVALNRDIMIRSFTLLFAFTFFTARSAAQGDVVLAANAILQKFFLVAGYFLDGIATAAEQIAGRAVGAKNRPAFYKALRLTTGWGGVLAVFAFLFFWIAGPNVISLMTTNGEIRSTAQQFLIWAAITPLCGVLAFQMDGIFIGATWSRDMRNMMLVSLFVFLAAYYALFPLVGNHGLWLSLLLFLGVRGLTLLLILPRRAGETFGPHTPAVRS